nr:type II toxin-antitoxin system RelE/ParE family toxin [Nitrosomonas sp. HPC101]
MEAKADIERLYRFLAEHDFDVAERTPETIGSAWSLLEQSPFSCRKIDDTNPFLRKFIISFGNSGYVALFEIEDNNTVTVLAVRHQLEDDYY